jgi:hypothetical protein
MSMTDADLDRIANTAKDSLGDDDASVVREQNIAWLIDRGVIGKPAE